MSDRMSAERAGARVRACPALAIDGDQLAELDVRRGPAQGGDRLLRVQPLGHQIQAGGPEARIGDVLGPQHADAGPGVRAARGDRGRGRGDGDAEHPRLG